MTRLELASEVAEDLQRILNHLERFEVENTALRIREIIEAISILESNPLIGRPTSDDMRELVIGRNARGYIALYRYITEIDSAFILAIRSQREAGYKRP
ncbi:MAG: type II toxin-antitoxin system RelE/ParE family toxin [Azonexus sp.]|nr:type II toxin-antitoxin system RelE/ParE family toxin [Azonexus sp.]MDZ4316727.1 type II toxin-antitoxin system RelE/ParE family toxin [Azonexus sp.]